MNSDRIDRAASAAPPVSPSPRARVLAFYLPQFHPIPENDAFWGKGFTEWTNVARARPLFRGHDQPRFPTDLGYYDLRVPEVREAQAELARVAGVSAFCYYHYWFAGHRVLERPFNEVVASGRPDFPFCLCWANETWSGIWHGAPSRTLIEQTYPGEADTRAHFDAIFPAMADPRYVRVGGRPLFVIYRPHRIPELPATLALWRSLAREAGLPGLYLVGCADLAPLPAEAGFDASISANLPSIVSWVSRRKPLRWIAHRYARWRGAPARFDYREIAREFVPENFPREGVHPVVIPNWDNSPRSGPRGLVLTGSSPAAFRPVLRRALDVVAHRPFEERIVFLKSWNEWAEGNYVEPDLMDGSNWLDVLREEILLGSQPSPIAAQISNSRPIAATIESRE